MSITSPSPLSPSHRQLQLLSSPTSDKSAFDRTATGGPGGRSPVGNVRRQSSISYTSISSSNAALTGRRNSIALDSADGNLERLASAGIAVKKHRPRPLSLALPTSPLAHSFSPPAQPTPPQSPPKTFAETYTPLLHFIAQKESRCLELRSQLAAEENELAVLKRKWEKICERERLKGVRERKRELAQREKEREREKERVREKEKDDVEKKEDKRWRESLDSTTTTTSSSSLSADSTFNTPDSSFSSSSSTDHSSTPPTPALTQALSTAASKLTSHLESVVPTTAAQVQAQMNKTINHLLSPSHQKRASKVLEGFGFGKGFFGGSGDVSTSPSERTTRSSSLRKGSGSNKDSDSETKMDLTASPSAAVISSSSSTTTIGAAEHSSKEKQDEATKSEEEDEWNW